MTHTNFDLQAKTYDLFIRLVEAYWQEQEPLAFYDRVAPICREAEAYRKELHNQVATKLARDTRNLAMALQLIAPFDTDRLQEIANTLDRIARS